MQKAAIACYAYILKKFPSKKILILCGPGNNGGDGVLIAQKLIEKNLFINISYPFGLPKTKDSKKALKLLYNKEKIKKNILFNKYDLVIDALFGTGLKKRPDSSILSFFRKVNKSNVKIISIDMPSGVSTDDGSIYSGAIKANITLSLQRFKPGHWLLPGKEYCGEKILLDIGLENLDKECNLQLNYPLKPPVPSLKDHKFLRGCCLVVVGENLVGASKLAYLSASQSVLRGGAGLCKLLVPEKYTEFFKNNIIEEMVIKYKDKNDFVTIIENEKCNTLIYGCGIENKKSNTEILSFLLKRKINLVLDAAVFSLFQNNTNKFFSLLNKRTKSTVMTPHAGEFKRIFNSSNNKINDSLKASQQSNSIIVYKGNDTVISSPTGSVFINAKSTPYLATAGSGDVLSGLIGAFLAQGVSALNSARLGCFIHTQCGINLGPGLVASDLVKEIPNILKKMIS